MTSASLARIDRLWRAGDRAGALDGIARLLGEPSATAEAHAVGAQLRLACNDLALARLGLEAALTRFPDDARLQFLDGECARRRGDGASAVARYRRALELAPQFVEAALFLGNVSFERGDYEAAERAQRRALELAPTAPAIHYNLGLTLAARGDASGALACQDAALALMPDYAAAQRARGVALGALGDPAAARLALAKALALSPNDGVTLAALATVELAHGSAAAALAAAERASVATPHLAEAWVVLGRAQDACGSPAAAATAYERALALQPGLAPVVLALASLHVLAGQRATAAAILRRGIAAAPGSPELPTYLVEVLLGSDDAAAAEIARGLRPDLGGDARRTVLVLTAFARVADWSAWEEGGTALVRALDAPSAGDPGMTLHYFPFVDDPALLQTVARRHVESLGLTAAARPAAAPGARLTVAYVSADFRDHPVGQSIVEVFERHRRDRVRLVGVSLAPADGGDAARRLRAACDEWFDGAGLDEATLAARVRALGVDVAIDLMGHTAHARPGLWAAGLAPVQASYLGFAGTQGAPWIDYLIADENVVPAAAAAAYDEAVVSLPVSFFPSDTLAGAADTRPVSRAAEGLPAMAPVLCAFVHPGRLSPAVFAVWLEWLAACPAAVLWLQDGPAASALRRRAGPLADRLVFARRVPDRADHLARHRLADLYVDAFPYNAHSTARDALWMGLPVLSAGGRSFASRVGASLLRAAGLPAFAVEGLDAYRRRGLELLEGDGARLRAARPALAALRASPLFDTARLVAELESAYRTMAERAAAGLPPAPFAVPLGGSAP